MKPKLLLLSDLWGFQDEAWSQDYIAALQHHHEVTLFDSPQLAGINVKGQSQDTIHRQLINGGIETAVQQLRAQVPQSIDMIIGCSVGGVIAWKAILAGLQTKKLVAISATRLRHETQKPDGDIVLYYGEQDKYRPSAEWSQSLQVTTHLLPGVGHDVYKERHFIKKLATNLLSFT